MRFLVILLYVFVYTLPAQLLWWVTYAIYYAVKAYLVGRLEYVRVFSHEAVFEGEEVEIIETVTNPTVFPLFFVDVESYIHSDLRLEGRDLTDGMQLVISRFHLPPLSRITRRYKVKCSHRGCYTMNSAVVITKSLTVEREKLFSFSEELFVYPKLLEFSPENRATGMIYGGALTDRRVVFDPFSVSGVRDYATGDPFKNINFKATARSIYGGKHRLKVNNYDYCSERIFMIYMNFAYPEDMRNSIEYNSLMDKGLSIAATFIGEALSCGYKAGFAANCSMTDGRQSIVFPVSAGAHHLEELLREMAMISNREGASFSALVDSGVKGELTNTEIYVLTAIEDDSVYDSIDLLEKYNYVSVIRL